MVGILLGLKASDGLKMALDLRVRAQNKEVLKVGQRLKIGLVAKSVLRATNRAYELGAGLGAKNRVNFKLGIKIVVVKEG